MTTHTEASGDHRKSPSLTRPSTEASKASIKSLSSRIRMGWASGSPNRQLNSRTMGPRPVIFSLRNDHTFARSETVGLHNDWWVKVRKGSSNFIQRITDGVTRRWDAVALHELLGKTLARFQPGCCFGRAKHRPSAASEFVHHSLG